MRSLLSANWPGMLASVVHNINATPLKSIGYLTPGSISSPLQDPEVAKAMKFKADPDVATMKRNQELYEQDRSKIQLGSYVFLNFAPSAFQKGYDTKFGQLFQICKIEASKSPVLYAVQSLKKKRQRGWYYSAQLTPTHSPEPNSFFKVQSILRTRKRKGKTQYLCRFQHYPPEYDDWINAEDVIQGKD